MKTHLPLWPRQRIAVGALSILPGLVGLNLMATGKPLPGAAPLTRLEGTKDLKVSTLPGSDGPIVKISGSFVSAYTAYADVADNTTFDLREYFSVPRGDHPTRTAFSVGEQPVPPKNVRIIGGVIRGTIPLEWSWTLTHSFGGSGFYTVASGRQMVEGARIHNVEDGWRPRETPGFRIRSYPNNGSFMMRGCYLTGIRDDAVEDDEFMPGDVEDSLFDGVHTFFSEQNEAINGLRTFKLPTIGPDEDPEIRITRSLVRLAVTCGGEPALGTWFKMHHYTSPYHRVVITDSVFAADLDPPKRWERLNFPKDAVFRGRNYLLWFGKPGTYGAKIPPGVTFIEGTEARKFFHQKRNDWLEAHGYEPRSPDDWNPMEAPVEAPRLTAAPSAP